MTVSVIVTGQKKAVFVWQFLAVHESRLKHTVCVSYCMLHVRTTDKEFTASPALKAESTSMQWLTGNNWCTAKRLQHFHHGRANIGA